jgi:hypothetical protein
MTPTLPSWAATIDADARAAHAHDNPRDGGAVLEALAAEVLVDILVNSRSRLAEATGAASPPSLGAAPSGGPVTCAATRGTLQAGASSGAEAPAAYSEGSGI